MLNRVGRYLEAGSYAREHLILAAKCYRHAAGSDSEAQVNYGFFLEHGLGVDRDAAKAAEFYERSICGDNASGTLHYALSLQFGTGFCEDLEAAADSYDVVVASNCRFLAENSSRCYRGLNRRKPLLAPQARLRRLMGRSNRQEIEFRIPDSISDDRVEAIGGSRQSVGRGVFSWAEGVSGQ